MKEITVAVGMSGGVDSSATALLLKKQGYTVGQGLVLYHGDELVGGGYIL